MASRQARILILCKTYPSPSGKHVETSCVAGMEEGGQLIRLFPAAIYPCRRVSAAATSIFSGPCAVKCAVTTAIL